MHYIRDIVLERLVLEAVSDLSDFVRCYEPVFLYLLAKKNNAMRQKEYQQLQKAVENGTKRIAEIDRLIEKVFEQNAGGILSDERFAKMLQNYEKEQKALTQEVEENRQTLQNTEQRVVDLRLVLRTLREMTDMKELTPTLVNSLIERIEVHNSNKSSGHSHVKVDIYFTAVGMIDTNEKRNPCHDGRNTEQPAGLQIRSITKGYGVTPFTELHCILHKNILIWRQQRLSHLYGLWRIYFYYVEI